ncbi:hypothetical protein BH18THE2_BH18THE2_22250 [soil metagenome]
MKFRAFAEARDAVHKLQLRSKKEWYKYTSSGRRPKDIPSQPYRTYKNEWRGWGDWLGTGTIASYNKKFLPFHEARQFARGLGLKSSQEWLMYCKSSGRHEDIPIVPSKTYKNEWEGWGDWLGATTFGEIKYLPFTQAREVVRKLGLKSVKEWEQYCKSASKRQDIPWKADRKYKKEWISWGDWLGTGRIADQNKIYRAFEEAKEFVNALKFRSGEEWKRYCKSGKKPDDIPASPSGTYGNKWKGMGDWLGTWTIANKKRKYLSFGDAREFIHSLQLRSRSEWREHCKSNARRQDIPANPAQTYKKFWKGWGDWLGTGFIAPKHKVYRPFEESREFVHGLRLRSQSEWRKYCKSIDKSEDIQ